MQLEVNIMKTLYMRCVVILWIVLLFTGCSNRQNKAVTINNGVLDITHFDFNQEGNIRLDGEWAFYVRKFLTYNELKNHVPDFYAKVPGVWNDYMQGDLAGEGFATYRLHVITDLPKDTMLGFRLSTFSSAYKLYVNDQLIASNGEVAETKAQEVGQYKPQLAFLNIPEREFDIIIHVSNFQYARGGFWSSIYMGNIDNIVHYHDKVMGKEVILIGALLIISLFYFSIFIIKKEFKYSLYFALLCIMMIISSDMVGQYIVVRIFPKVSFKLIIALWYTATTWLLFFLIIYMQELFRSNLSFIITRLYLGFAIVIQLLVLFTPMHFYTRFGYIGNIIDIAGVLGTLIIVVVGIQSGHKYGWLNLVSIAVVLITYIHDVLYWTNVTTSRYGEMIYMGVFLFILVQMIIQAKKTKEFYDNKIAAELSFLQAQIKPHFLYNAINTFISISHYDVDQSRKLLMDFSKYLRKSFDFKDLSQKTSLKNEIELVRAYIEIEKARFEERLIVHYDICEDLEVQVPILVLQPIIENAINHGVLHRQEGGQVDIIIKEKERLLFFTVKDNGVGMEISKDKNIENKDINGIGLYNIDIRLKKLYKKGLTIHSTIGIGTEISWVIPIEKA